MSPNSRGYALVDLVVGMAVFALVTAGVYQVFIPVLKFAHSTNDRLSVQQDVRLAMDRMSRDMRESTILRVRVYSGGTAIGLATARAGCTGSYTVDGVTGAPLWQAMTYLVLDGASDEVRRYCDTSSTFPAPAPVTAGSYEVLARNVQALTFAVLPSPQDPVSVVINLHERTPRGDADRYIRTEFLPQND